MNCNWQNIITITILLLLLFKIIIITIYYIYLFYYILKCNYSCDGKAEFTALLKSSVSHDPSNHSYKLF